MESKKCPVCESDDTLELEKEHGDYYDCRICFFRCAPHNLHRIAAAMDLERELVQLKDALRRIANYSSYGDYKEEDKKLLTARDKLSEDINNCAECARARKSNWPPSGMCSTHYIAFMRIQASIKHMHEHKETYEPRNIAREALAKPEEK